MVTAKTYVTDLSVVEVVSVPAANKSIIMRVMLPSKQSKISAFNTLWRGIGLVGIKYTIKEFMLKQIKP